MPVGPGGRLRRLRLAARRRRGAARAEDRGAARAAAAARGAGGRGRPRSRRRGTARRACWAGGTGCGSRWTARAGPGLRAHRSHDVLPIADCPLDPVRRRCCRCWRSGSPPAARSRWRSTPTGSGTCTPVGSRVAVRRSCNMRRAGSGSSRPGRSGRCTRRWPTCWRRSWGSGRRRRRAGSPGTSTAGSGCSRPCSPSRSGATGRWRWSSRRARPWPTGVRRSPTCPRSTGGPAASSTCCRRCPGPRTSWSPTRRAAGWAARWSRRCATARRAVSCTSPATPRPWPATSRCSPTHGYRLAALRAFDAFPMTHHLEATALFLPA